MAAIGAPETRIVDILGIDPALITGKSKQAKAFQGAVHSGLAKAESKILEGFFRRAAQGDPQAIELWRKQVEKAAAAAAGGYRLTGKQRLFAEGVAKGLSATAAAREAGYATTYANRYALQLLDNPRVAAYLASLNAEARSEAIAGSKARQSWWTEVMNDATVEIRHRLKAAELLGRAQGDFVHRLEHSGPDGGPIQVGTQEQQLEEMMEKLAQIASNQEAGKLAIEAMTTNDGAGS
jgi:hypothetical protein